MQTFSKQERLCGKKQIDNLFATGESFKEGSFAVIWKTQKRNPEFPAQIMISIPKRNIAKANQRNLLKRLVREAYRKQKQTLYKALSKQEKQIIFAIIYLKSNIIKNKEVELEINVVLNRLIKQL
ncbi:MAG TPA: ribonuclease P protein component [Flavobacteriales bacterium]|nr:ribonuclease P protein component [Flavobacteriales bacterium]HIK62549.1 ribonuclease P protein component [Flavobacteriales bacterium]